MFVWKLLLNCITSQGIWQLRITKSEDTKAIEFFAIDGFEFTIDKTREDADIFKPRANSASNKTNAKISMLFDVVTNYKGILIIGVFFHFSALFLE